MNGKCLCGGVSISAPRITDISVCHCSMCRRWGGGPFLALHAGSDIAFSGELGPSRFRSSDWAERGFCPRCGTSLFYHLLQGDVYILSAGLFQNESGFQVVNQIFIDEKPEYYALANKTPELTGAAVFAQFIGPEE